MIKNVLLFLISVALLASCHKSDDEVVPSQVKKELIGHEFSGEAKCFCLESPVETSAKNITVSATSNTLNIQSLPIGMIVDSIFGKGSVQKLGIDLSKKGNLNLKYKLFPTPTPNVYAIQASNGQISVQVEINNNLHKLDINFLPTSQDVGLYWYNSEKKTLDFRLVAESLFLDGQRVRCFASKPDSIRNTTFIFPITVKQ